MQACNSRGIAQAKNMHREIAKAKIQQMQDNPETLEFTDRIYKPSYTIEFNRVGEVLLYSCEPFKHLEIYLKYPYVLYETLIPLSLGLWYLNPLELEWHYNHMLLFFANVGNLFLMQPGGLECTSSRS